MLRDRNIAFFIDVDNVGLTSENYAEIVERLSAMGSLLCGKIYGAGERKHKEIYADADLRGYATARPMRIKRRGRKDFDSRIFVDVVDAVTRAPAIDAVCIVAQPTDLVHLYSYLRGRGLKIIALANADEASNALIDEVLNVELATPVKTPKKPAKKPTPKVVEPAPEKPEQVKPQPVPVQNDELDRTDELLREIERLRANASPVESVEEPAPEEVESVEEPVEEVVEESAEEVVPESLDETEEPVEEQPVEQEDGLEEAQEEVPEEVSDEQPVEEQPAGPTARPAYTPSNERDLIRRIEEIRRNSQGEEEDFIDEIKKLLDGLE